MKVKILKGTNQIGGCITEIESNSGTKIIIDFGEDLEDNKKEIHVDGLTEGISKYQGVFITHSHGDHIGLVEKINKDIPLFIEKETKEFYNISCDFIKDAISITRDVNYFSFGEVIEVGDLKVTPYLIDHSSYNSCMFLIEGDGKRIVHTGDYRNHGRKGRSFDSTLKKIGKIDLLITEGTTFGRNNEKYKTEDELLEEANVIFGKYHQVLLLASSTNIDRLVTFYKASNHTKKYFVEDLFTATIASHLKDTIPSPKTHSNVSIWITNKYYRKPKNFKEKYIVPMEQYKRNKPFHHDFCMMIKPSMLDDIKEKLYGKGLLDNACVIYSMWDGYLEDEKMNTFIKELKDMDIDFIKLHTSGHADVSAMKEVEEVLNPNKVVLIHTEHKEMAKEVFKNMVDISDGEEIEV